MKLFLDVAATLYEANNFYDIGKIIISILQKSANNPLINGKIGIYNKEIDEYKIFYISDEIEERKYLDEETYKIVHTSCKFSEIKYYSRIVADTKKTLIIQDNHSEMSLKIHLAQKKAEPHAMMWIPLVYKDEFLGIISLASKPINSFTDEIVETIESIAKLTSIKVYELYTSNKLIRNEERFRSIYENVTIGLYRTAPDGKILLANPALVTMLGFSSFEELSKRNLESDGFEPGYTRDQFKEKLQKEREIFGIEAVWTKKDGTKIYVRESAKAKFNIDGSILYYEGTIEDITKRREAEESLKESNDKLTKIAEIIPGYIAYVNANTLCYEFINSAYEKSFGIPRQLILGSHVKDIIGEKNFQFALKHIEEARSGKSVSYENVFDLSTGKRWIRVNYIPDIDKNGNVKSIVVFNYDITERKQTEEVLNRNREEFKDLFDEAPVGYHEIDNNGLIIRINTTELRMLGYTAEELLGQPVWKLIADQNLSHQAVLAKLNGEIVPSQPYEREFLKKDGSKLTALVKDKIFKKEDGSIFGIRSALQDITERKYAEKALIENERLSIIAEFALDVAHNFNNALQIILGNIELAFLEPNSDEETHKYLTKIKNSASNAASRVRDLQRFATKENRKVDFNALNLHVLLDDVIEQVKSKFKDESEKNEPQITIQKKYGEIKSIDGNLAEIRIIFHHLIKNAIEAMPNGGGITFETGILPKGVFVHITDTGIGMNEKTKMRIFQPFYTTKGFEIGKGLGLSIVFAILRDHGGEIYVKESIPGKGTTIGILLPFGIKKEESQAEISISRDIETKISARILWVDDEEEIREVGKFLLKKLGHQADTAASGDKALNLLEKNKYDLVITDLGMPKMNGWQLAEIINERHKGTKVAVVTGWGTSIDKAEKDKYGIISIIGKPIEIKELGNLVLKVMHSK